MLRVSIAMTTLVWFPGTVNAQVRGEYSPEAELGVVLDITKSHYSMQRDRTGKALCELLIKCSLDTNGRDDMRDVERQRGRTMNEADDIKENISRLAAADSCIILAVVKTWTPFKFTSAALQHRTTKIGNFGIHACECR